MLSPSIFVGGFLACVAYTIFVAHVARITNKKEMCTLRRPSLRDIITNLERDVYCRLSCTNHGVGVRAVRHIPCGIDPFTTSDAVQRYQWVPVSALTNVHPQVKTMVFDFFKLHKNAVPVPDGGLNSITIDFFMNHSETPNVGMQRRIYHQGEYVKWKTLRDIKPGEELTINYESLKEALD